jgi:hypothetical protein
VWLSRTDWRRVRAFAAAQGIAPATALQQLVVAGLATREESRHGPFVEIEESLGRIRRLLDRLGPAILGLPHLLAYWATREVEDVTADDLLAEFTANAEALWRDALAGRVVATGRRDGT